MALKKVLITVLTYPTLSKKHQEDLVCTAGILESGDWIRIYPVTLDFLKGLRSNDKVKSYKYSWIELDLEKKSKDFRPESYFPTNDLKDLKVIGHIDTKYNWLERKKYCLNSVYENMDSLIEASKEPNNVSLAVFKPKEILSLEVERVNKKNHNLSRQPKLNLDIFGKIQPINQLPYKFYYRFKDLTGKTKKLQIIDWEIGQLYWNCLKSYRRNEQITIKKVGEKYETEFINECDLFFFLGTSLKWHKTAKNPFVIIGIFYPQKESNTGQLKLF